MKQTERTAMRPGTVTPRAPQSGSVGFMKTMPMRMAWMPQDTSAVRPKTRTEHCLSQGCLFQGNKLPHTIIVTNPKGGALIPYRSQLKKTTLAYAVEPGKLSAWTLDELNISSDR